MVTLSIGHIAERHQVNDTVSLKSLELDLKL